MGESPIFKLVLKLMPMPVVKHDKAARSFISRAQFHLWAKALMFINKFTLRLDCEIRARQNIRHRSQDLCRF